MSTPKVYLGVRVPRFRRGELSSRKLNTVAAIVEALANLDVRYGPAPAAYLSDANCVVQVPRSSGGSGSTNAQEITITGHNAEYISGTDSSSTAVNVLKPPALRFSVTSETIDGTSVAYSAHDTTNQTRTATWDTTQTEEQVIGPRYIAGQKLWAVPIDAYDAGGGVTCTFVEVTSGRAWQKIVDRVCGTIDLVAGQRNGSVGGLALSSVPKQILLTVCADAAVFAVVRTGYDANQFDYALSAAVPTGSQLFWEVIL